MILSQEPKQFLAEKCFISTVCSVIKMDHENRNNYCYF